MKFGSAAVPGVPGSVEAHFLMDGESIDHFIAFLDVRPASAMTYRRCLQVFSRWLTDKGIRTLKREDILLWKEFLVEAGKQPTTIQTYLYVVRRFLAWASQARQFPNIAAGIKGPVVSHIHKRDALTIKQVLGILEAIDRGCIRGLRDYAILMVMLTGGLRCIEVSRARVTDVRPMRENTVLYIQGKGKDERNTEYMKLEPPVERSLREYLSARGNPSGDAPLFASVGRRAKEARLSSKGISWIVKGAMRKAGYDDSRLTAHSLRHTAITLALMGGEDLEAVKVFARHTNISTTLIYSHAISRETNTCENTITNAIFA